MKLASTAVLLLAIVGSAWSEISEEDLQEKAPWLIIPGPKAADVEKFSWQVAVIADDSFFCSGSLVTPKWVLTAAHCTTDYQVFDLAIGSDQSVRQTTRNAKRHPEYKPDTQDKDLALLEVSSEVPLSPTVRTVRFPSSGFSEISLDGTDLYLSGWASLEDKLSIWAGVSSPPLKWILVRGAPDSACHSTYGSNFSPNKLCLSTTSSPHVEGFLSLADGGTPVVSLDTDGNFTQVGVLSFGPGHSTLRPPVVATKIVSVLPWIKEVTGLSAGNKDE